MSSLTKLLAAAALGTAAIASQAQELRNASITVDSSMILKVADGCGINGWRGPWGHCHYARPVMYGPPFYSAPYYAPTVVVRPVVRGHWVWR
ncbi:hypothetical protein [Variovorax sp. OV329]|uniref:GCG_CRPN prefix-to-repeats domain-containing protein n=1 Tax=Variovorax sp. OV329 TaxID=1882825 RepID=UPI0008F0AADD|nr:hypothetical protein [Variovorax sp. OV329]SFM94679.1 hypothetical protein SAMN05444747_111171 [Variovorax sp. OV329]